MHLKRCYSSFFNERFRPTTLKFLQGVYDIHTKILTVHLPEQSKTSLLHSEAEFASNLSFTYKNQILSYSSPILLFYSIISLTQTVVNRN